MNLMAASFEKKWTPQQQLNMRKLAITHFDRALEIWPDFFNAAYDKGRAALVVGDIPNAIAGFEQAVTMDNDFMDPYYQLSELYINTRQYPQFLMNARRLFDKETERPEKYGLMARAHYLNANADSAKYYLRRSIRQFPDYQEAYKNMAEIFRVEGNADSTSYYGNVK
jgi:tetratricopeptide (TPR) repeat protein